MTINKATKNTYVTIENVVGILLCVYAMFIMHGNNIILI